MVKSPLNWFPNDFFTNAFFLGILIVFVVDAIMPMFLRGRRAGPPTRVKERGLFILIQICVVLALGIGIACRVNNLGIWMGALIALVLILAPTLYRIRVEEKTLLYTFGEEYRRYMLKTWRLIPGW